MQALLKLARMIDAVNERIGKLIVWLVLVAVLISAGNAVMRKAFDISSNACLEIQWYLFSAIFLLGAGYALLQQRARAHRRHLRPAVRAHADAGSTSFGIVVFLLPLRADHRLAVLAAVHRAPGTSGEMSPNAGGLIRWPVLAAGAGRLRAAAAAGRCPN
ncbi:MAG: hypothetical protein MZV65_44400 [Chromatiales bacterium]|nr:hypothetical protein [Chromatiales bacterium]